MSIRESLLSVLKNSTAADLWKLRSDLLEAGLSYGDRVWNVMEKYQHFLEQLASCMTSRYHSDLASKLDIGSISGVVLERVLEPQGGRELALSLLAGALSEGLMVAATRQHVKAWEEGIASYIKSTAWYLYGELWWWTQEVNPGLPAAERRRQLDALFAPVFEPAQECSHQAVLLGLLFQILLLGRISGALPGSKKVRTKSASV